jgi:hypothetical protein
VTSHDPGIDQINRELPAAGAFTHNGMCYAKLTGVIAAARSRCELREQIRGYAGRNRMPPDAW